MGGTHDILEKFLNGALLFEERAESPEQAGETFGTTSLTPAPYGAEIFRKTSDEDAVWLEAVQGLGQTTKRFLQRRSTSTGEYLVFDATEAKFIDVSDEAESA